ncbi:NEQ031 [Nanoarchaeum equitans Kin4-M]|uniref:NEQ031 n=1 Tax=Nanoarchaeum equitans (strain Kin4-M) TaxID=228908 RepID=Q74MG4_NANEQ|nr:NEQ031 [Nanoarchaeum equitans Kin4-M]
MFSFEIEKKPNIIRNKKKLEERLNIELEEKENSYIVKANDGLTLNKAIKIIDALNAGFGEEAYKLLDDNYDFMVIPIKRATKNDKERKRILARLIGTKGKAKKNISNLTGVSVIIDDKKKEAYLLGKIEDLIIARESINRIIEGQPHGKVYSFLESNRRLKKLRDLRDSL